MPITFFVASEDRYENRGSARSVRAASDQVGSKNSVEAATPSSTSASGPQTVRPAPPSRLADRVGVPVFAAMIAVSAAILLVWGPIAGLGPVRSLIAQPLVALLLTISFAATMLGTVSVHYKGQTYLLVLSEVPLLLGLVIAAPPVLVICCFLGEALALGAIRRQSPPKLAFNLASSAMSSVVAILVYRAVLGPFIARSGARVAVLPIGWAAGALALGAAFVFGHLAVSIVVRLKGKAQQRKYGFEFTTVALVLVSSIALALVVLDAACIVFAYRGYLRLTNRFGALQQLYDFSRSVSGPYLETTGTAWAVLEQVQSVMRSNRAELIIVDEWPSVRHVALSGTVRSTVERTIVDVSSVIARAITSQQTSLLLGTSGSHKREPDADSFLGEFRGAVVVPLASGERTLGALVALDRDEGFDAFDDDDLRLFEALAAHASTTMERAQLVEELRLEAESKWHQATHDLLTGLPNRALFLDRAASALTDTGRAAIALLDLDRFKEVNDTLGHDTGDRLLCEVAECLVRASSGRATVARLGGDEFAIVVPDIIGPEEALGIVRDLLAAISKPMNIDGITLAVTATTGIALAPEHGDNVATLLQRADIAMYHAKDKRSGIELYLPEHDQSMQRKLLLGGHLAEALSSGQQLSVMYQPIAGMVSGEVVRVEALARWFHPVHGQVPADEFIQIAEQMGLIGQITDFVLTEACDQAARWRREGLDIGLAINISGRDLSDRSLVRNVTAHLGANGLPASLLTLEITETEVMADIAEASDVLGQLADLGVRIAVDDYGTGYSSLAYLHRLPANELKLDRSFVANVAADQSNSIIVRSSIAMAHSLGLSVVAEGAEDEITCAILADAGCDALQGYYFSPPLGRDDLLRWLATHPRLRFSRELASSRSLRIIPGRLEGTQPDDRTGNSQLRG
ncbi:MAG: EAL domain-containing protein [Acidimicrobiales bacterium]